MTVAVVLLGGLIAPAGARPWHVGVGGAWASGYLGLLAREGLPRERLLDDELTNKEFLRKFDLVLVASPVPDDYGVRTAIEDFVRNGGVALVDYQILPSAAAIPGQRVSAGKGANFEFITGAHPVCQGLAGAPMPNLKRPSVALVPDAGTNAVVLARYEPSGGGSQVAPELFSGGVGLPAVVLVPLGKGTYIYAGVDINR
jgi:hypothetical protein